MARYSSNFGNKLQLMVGIGKKCSFTSSFNMPQPFTPKQNGVTAQNGEQPIRLPKGSLHLRVEVEQRTHSGDEIDFLWITLISNPVASVVYSRARELDCSFVQLTISESFSDFFQKRWTPSTIFRLSAVATSGHPPSFSFCEFAHASKRFACPFDQRANQIFIFSSFVIYQRGSSQHP